MSDNKENVEKINTKNPLETISAKLIEAEKKKVFSEIEKVYGETLKAKEVFDNSRAKLKELVSDYQAMGKNKFDPLA